MRYAPSSSTDWRSRRQPRKSCSSRRSSWLAAESRISISTMRSPSGRGSRTQESPVRSYQPAPMPIAIASASPPATVRPGNLTSIRIPSFTSSHDMPIRIASPWRKSRRFLRRMAVPPARPARFEPCGDDKPQYAPSSCATGVPQVPARTCRSSRPHRPHAGREETPARRARRGRRLRRPGGHYLPLMIFCATAISSRARSRSDSARATARPKLVRR